MHTHIHTYSCHKFAKDYIFRGFGRLSFQIVFLLQMRMRIFTIYYFWPQFWRYVWSSFRSVWVCLDQIEIGPGRWFSVRPNHCNVYIWFFSYVFYWDFRQRCQLGPRRRTGCRIRVGIWICLSMESRQNVNHPFSLTIS